MTTLAQDLRNTANLGLKLAKSKEERQGRLRQRQKDREKDQRYDEVISNLEERLKTAALAGKLEIEMRFLDSNDREQEALRWYEEWAKENIFPFEKVKRSVTTEADPGEEGDRSVTYGYTDLRISFASQE